MRLAGGVQLTYCTNIHPSSGMGEVRANLERYAVPLRERLSPDAPFGIGLRLSGQESAELVEGSALADFKAFLDERGLYVFTMNGFPYGPFHGQPVKAQVHAPDWRDEERVAYTLRLAEILAALLPEGEEGGISTSPLSYREWVGEGDWERLTGNVVRVVEALVHLRQTRNCFIHLDIEPEPDGLLQCSDDLARFFTEHLLEGGARDLAARLGVRQEQAREHLRNHVQVCFDTCHVAVMYEDPARALQTYEQAGLRIGKIQISSALRLPLPPAPEARLEVAQALSPFAEGTYLHQVIARRQDGEIVQYPDLPPALAGLNDPAMTEWRVHFHVPVFLERAGLFGSTQAEIVETLALLRGRPFTRHLEIETYTWDVLPDELKLPLLDSIEREYRWVRDVL
ncbi:sugar phosphate isomerase family enzyme [Deinococcus aerius]|uniref:Sugar phosphate isomerase family enzyme n=1 Tax=Deinococcus aerius TaxID=200253 RepID=A0A2I9CWA8_9DEIO|nr:metabolite traffic protein EboE [Deinococcus aerius]GBF06274.1 sugar phosphate isomerase family enzyme [Deinococcus aerius]